MTALRTLASSWLAVIVIAAAACSSTSVQSLGGDDAVGDQDAGHAGSGDDGGPFDSAIDGRVTGAEFVAEGIVWLAHHVATSG